MREASDSLRKDRARGAMLGAHGPSGALGLRESDELAAALGSRVAGARGVRAMIIKGFSLEFHGLRRGHISADVDIYVGGRDPANELIDALVEHGWKARPETLGERLATTHSAALVHDAWPNDIDVHWEYPGLATNDEAVFDSLWSSRVRGEVAGVGCWYPDKSTSIVLWALHSLRGTSRQPRHRLELEQLVREVLPALHPHEREALGSRIVELGADRALRDVPELAEVIGDRASPIDERRWRSWQAKLAQAREVSPWIQMLREAPIHERPHMLSRAVWPSARDLRLLDPSLVDSPIGRSISRWRRLVRGAERRLRGTNSPS